MCEYLHIYVKSGINLPMSTALTSKKMTEYEEIWGSAHGIQQGKGSS
jgi:hypothetical protein